MPSEGWKCYVVPLTLDTHFVFTVFDLDKNADDKYITTPQSKSFGPPFGTMPVVHVHANPIFFALNIGECMGGVPVEAYPPTWTPEEKQSVSMSSKIFAFLKGAAVDKMFKPKRRAGLHSSSHDSSRSGTPETRFIGPLTMYDVDDVDDISVITAAKAEQRERFAGIGVSPDELAVLDEDAQAGYDD